MEKMNEELAVERVLADIENLPGDAYLYPSIGNNDNEGGSDVCTGIDANRVIVATALCEMLQNSKMTAAHIFALTGYDALDGDTFVRLDKIKKSVFLLLVDWAENKIELNEDEMDQYMVSNVFNPEFLRNRVKGTEQNCVQIEAALAHIVREKLLADVYNPEDVMDVSVDRDNLRYLFALVVKLFEDSNTITISGEDAASRLGIPHKQYYDALQRGKINMIFLEKLLKFDQLFATV